MDQNLRKQVIDRAGGRCEYCQVHQDAAPFYTFPVDHIIAGNTEALPSWRTSA